MAELVFIACNAVTVGSARKNCSVPVPSAPGDMNKIVR